jgi:TolB-like protein
MIRWIVLALVAAPLAAGAAPTKPKLAVMDLKAGQGLSARAASTLTTILAADAARAGFQVITQEDVYTLLYFQKQRQMLGCTDDGCLAEIGGALGADYVLSGEAAVVGSRHHVAISLLDARKGSAAARSAGYSDLGDEQLAMASQLRFRSALRQVRPDLLATLPPVEAPNAPALRRKRTAAWWTLGAGGALLAGGAVTGLVARAQANALPGAWQQPDYQARYDTQRRTARAADVLLGAGALAAGVGLTLYLTSEIPVLVTPIADAGVPGLTVAGRF